jgi:hypothetical protein
VARSINRFRAAADVSEDFRGANIAANGTTLHVRVGGHGPAVVLLHGFGDTGDMWAPVAAALEVNHTVIVPDLRGMTAVGTHSFLCPDPTGMPASGRGRSAVPAVLGVGAPIGGDAYAGMSSTMRPSLQPYLASKSAFTVAPS